MNLEELYRKLESNDLEIYFSRLQPLVRNTIRFYQQEAIEDEIAIGETKIGGRPDLPSSISWVTETNTIETTEKKFLIFKTTKQETITKPLSFIAQVNLSETAAYDKDKLLPEKGILYFFYSAEQEASGFDPSDKNKFKVIYWDGDIAELKRTEFPPDLPEYSCYQPATVTIRPEISLPSYGHEVYEDFDEEADKKFWEEVYVDGNLNKLLGYADPIQNDMELDCELVTNGLYCGDATGYNDPRAKALEANASQWKLLLQIDSNEENKMMWGDLGRLYYWIKKEDLLNKRFDRCWIGMQCT